MRSIAVCGGRVRELLPVDSPVAEVELDGEPFTFARISAGLPPFDPRQADNSRQVLVQVKAFSCNYRDRGIIRMVGQAGSTHSFFPIGSEFVAEVVAVGSEVTRFRAGDRVIGDNHYPGAVPTPGGARPGIPTNKSSKEYLALHEEKLIAVPAGMPTAVAAAFSIGAQTVYSMIRKLAPERGANVLVTAAKSNTSLFAISALRKHGVNVYATTSSMRFADELKTLGVKEVFELRLEDSRVAAGGERLRDLAQGVGGFQYVIDPFYDVHLPLAFRLMAAGARYATCGLAAQAAGLGGQQPSPSMPGLVNILNMALMNNYQLIINCLGQTADLAAALDDDRAGEFRVVVDSVYRGDDIGGFVERTFNSRERFGKVVYEYD